MYKGVIMVAFPKRFPYYSISMYYVLSLTVYW